MSTADPFRARVDAVLDGIIARFYEEVSYAKHMLEAKTLNLQYYRRHNIETVLRIRLKRTVDALAIRYFTKRDPPMAKAWAEYTAEEMLHDSMFVKDLEHVGVPKAHVYAEKPLFATQLLMGYLLYDIEYHDSPLALISSVYFVEYTTTRTQPQWLDNIARSLGNDAVTGARAHVGTDLDDAHDDFVWNVLASLVKTPEDEEKVLEHMQRVYELYAMYFTDLFHRTVQQPEPTMAAV